MRPIESGFVVVYLGLLMAVVTSLGGFLMSCPASAAACPNGISLTANTGTYAGGVVAAAGGALVGPGLLRTSVRHRWLTSFQRSVVAGFILAYGGLMLSLLASYRGTVVVAGQAGTWLTVTSGTYAGGAVSAAGWGLVAAGLFREHARTREPHG